METGTSKGGRQKSKGRASSVNSGRKNGEATAAIAMLPKKKEATA
jgi:hypothetical protein